MKSFFSSFFVYLHSVKISTKSDVVETNHDMFNN